RLLEALDPEAADLVAEALDPGFQASVAEAGALLHSATADTAPPVAAVVAAATEPPAAQGNREREARVVRVPRVEPAPQTLPIGREVELRTRPNYTWLFAAFAASLLGYLIPVLAVSFYILAGILGAVFLLDVYNTQPVTHLARARAQGDQVLVDALLDHLAEGGRRTGT
ncbi:MAG TPA: hypothetical protein VEI97_19460, partial [bacterium]|nr:hypothetical protein [bacterium]